MDINKTTKALQEKWAPVLDVPGVEPITNPTKRAVLAQILENTENALTDERTMMTESSFSNGDFNYAAANSTGRAGYDPILINMLRRAAPQLMAFDTCGVQAMSAPTQLIFVLKSRYVGQANTNTEALFNEANVKYSGNPFNETANKAPTHGAGTDAVDEPTAQLSNPFSGVAAGAVTATAANYGGTVTSGVSDITGMATRLGEGDNFREMSFSIEKTNVVATTRALKSEFTLELVQDLKAVHGLDAETELSNILSSEILFEINREIIHTINSQAKIGCQGLTNNGNFDLLADGQGRWLVERQKGLMLQIEKECNQIAFDTRRGRGNFIICTANVASSLTMAGLLDYSSALKDNLNVDVTSGTFAGVLNGRVKVYVDPYATVGDYITVGYKGSEMDAGLFYCPYVPVQMLRAIHPDTFQPKMGMKTRYGMVSNPFANASIQANGLVPNQTNLYYRIMRVLNI